MDEKLLVTSELLVPPRISHPLYPAASLWEEGESMEMVRRKELGFNSAELESSGVWQRAELGSLAAFGRWQCHAAFPCTLCYSPGMLRDVVLVTAMWEGIFHPSQHAYMWISKGFGQGKAVLEPLLTLI